MMIADAELEGAVAGLAWRHSLRLRAELVTPGAISEAQLIAEETALFADLNLRGAHLLDAGAADGYFSFAAFRRGAARVLATEERGDAAARLAAAALGLPVEFQAIAPRHLGGEFGSFHVTLAMDGMARHASPIAALRGLAQVTSHVLLVETGQAALEDARPVLMLEESGWAPNPLLMRHLLGGLGFDRILHCPHPTLGATRGLFAAFRPAVPEALPAVFRAPWASLPAP